MEALRNKLFGVRTSGVANNLRCCKRKTLNEWRDAAYQRVNAALTIFEWKIMWVMITSAMFVVRIVLVDKIKKGQILFEARMLQVVTNKKGDL